jgi:hypothetical protein
LVLDRDDRLPHDRCDLLGLHEDPALVSTEHGQDGPAVLRVDDGVDVRALSCRIERRDLARDCADEPEGEGEARRDEEDGHQRRKTTLANPAPRTRRSLLYPNPQGGQF